MIDSPINDGKTIAGGGKDVVLFGRYHIIRRSGQGNLFVENYTGYIDQVSERTGDPA